MTDMTITEQGLTFDVAAFLKANAPYLRFADEGGDLTLLHVFNDNCFAFLYRKGKTHKAIEVAVWIEDDVKAVLEVKNYRGNIAVMFGWHPSTVDDALIASYCHRFLPLALDRLSKTAQAKKQS